MNKKERAVMQQALEALEIMQPEVQMGEGDAAITALRAALSKQRQKPDSMKEVYARLRERAMRSRM